MKTAVSLPDELFEQADQLARRLEQSRSELYRHALEDYLARHDPDQVRNALDRVVERLTGPDNEFARAAAAAILERSQW